MIEMSVNAAPKYYNSSVFFYYFNPLRSKYCPQKPVLKHPNSMLFP
jgi:hypothetical protein